MIDKKALNPIARKLYEGFIQAHFRWSHFEQTRAKYRRAFFEAMKKQKFNDSVKIIDFDMNLLTHLKWIKQSPGNWRYDPEYPGYYSQITPLPYECITEQTVLKCNRKATRNPLKILESGKHGK